MVRRGLRTELLALRLRGLQVEEDLTLERALRALEKLVRRLSANGPTRYRDEQSMLDVIDGALVQEEWADTVKAALAADD